MQPDAVLVHPNYAPEVAKRTGQEVASWPSAVDPIAKDWSSLSGKAVAVMTLGLEARQAEDLAASVRKGGAATVVVLHKEGKGDTPQPRPTPQEQKPAAPVQIIPGELPRVVDDCEALLLRSDLPAEQRIFQRGGQLVRVAVLPAPGLVGGVDRPAGAAIIVPADVTFLRDLLGRIGLFEKFDRRSNQWVMADLPKPAAEVLLARKGLWKLPLLRGVIACPTLRPDGSLLTAPGYDQASGYFLADGLSVKVTDAPTREEATAALEALRGLLDGFSFVSGVDQAVALALVLTAVARPALDSTPIINVSAPVRGSGKSTLVDIAAVLAMGRRCAVLSATGNSDELEKRIVGCLLSGDAMVSLDNLNGQLASDLLCQASTAEAVKLRPLGASPQVEIENTTMWTANGNNLVMSGDLSRRALVCRLDPGVEKPEERTFSFDPVARARENRAAYVGHVLTVLRGYIAAGRPNIDLTPFGSFERWSSLVRSALVWAGAADPCESRESVMDEDPELARLRALLVAWYERFGRTPQNVKEVLRAVQGEEDTDLATAVEEVATDRRGRVTGQSLGLWLRRNMGRISAGLKLQRFSGSQGVANWQVLEI